MLRLIKNYLIGLGLLLLVYLFTKKLEEQMERKRFEMPRWMAVTVYIFGLYILMSLMGCASKGLGPNQFANRLAIKRNVIVESGGNLGSGVVIEKGYVLTAKHMQVDSFPVYVNDKLARVVGKDPKSDLMLLSVPTDSFPPITLASSIGVAEPVFYVGNPIGKVGYVSIGHVTWMDSTVINTSTLPMPGSSGGGLYNLQGELVGINSTIQSPIRLPVFISAAVPTPRIHKFLGPRFIAAQQDGTVIRPP